MPSQANAEYCRGAHPRGVGRTASNEIQAFVGMVVLAVRWTDGEAPIRLATYLQAGARKITT